MEEKNKSAIEVLATLHRRPTSEEALSLLEKDILNSGHNLGFPLEEGPMKQIYSVQEAVFPIMESMMGKLLMANEGEKPSYYPLARDCELIYDALWSLGTARDSTLHSRLHLLKASLATDWDQGYVPYLKEIGITPERVRKGPPIIFLDSGFRGSMFDQVKYTLDVPALSPTFKGYLVCKSESSSYEQLGFTKRISEKQKRLLKESLKNSPYKDIKLISVEAEEVYKRLCTFMQLMPKATGRYVKAYQTNEGLWDVMPQQNSLVTEKVELGKANEKLNTSNERCSGDNYAQINSISQIAEGVNEDIVNPLGSLLLQQRTLRYFSDPKVQERVYNYARIEPS